ncbi:MAG: ATP-binding cassette domain-containing protein [Bacilli bacterium]|nr:ATP-binding cassette domain-containing protein [Bacilli bacterium]
MLKVENIVKTFNLTGNAEDVRIALNNVSLEVNEGDFITIIGGNGSGKSTLMNIISGVFLPDSGHVYIDNECVDKLKEHQRAKYLGRVFQDPMMGTSANMSVLENCELAIRRGQRRSAFKWGFTKDHYHFFEQEMIKLDLGLESRMNQKVGLLSGGQRQALTLLMASFEKPKILLLDEHTAALDPKTAEKVMTITNEIVTSEHITTLMITHNMKDAIKYGNRLIMLNNGSIILDIKGEEKAKLSVEDLLKKFSENSEVVMNDKLILSD